jgi:large subunit ribosomal protein L5
VHFLNNYNSTILKYDFLNKFLYKTTKKLPKLEKIILHVSCKTANLKDLSINLLGLELITGKRGQLTFTKKANILLKLRKGNPIGCKIILRNTAMSNFLTRLYTEGLTKMKNINELKFAYKKNKNNDLSFVIKDIFIFEGFEKHYYLFNNINKIDISFITTTYSKEELTFIFKSYKLPFKT